MTVSANSRDSKVVNDCINILTSEDLENTPHGSWTKSRFSFKFSSLTLVSIKRKQNEEILDCFRTLEAVNCLFYVLKKFPNFVSFRKPNVCNYRDFDGSSLTRPTGTHLARVKNDKKYASYIFPFTDKPLQSPTMFVIQFTR